LPNPVPTTFTDVPAVVEVGDADSCATELALVPATPALGIIATSRATIAIALPAAIRTPRWESKLASRGVVRRGAIA
jgi:hypothetical protein